MTSVYISIETSLSLRKTAEEALKGMGLDCSYDNVQGIVEALWSTSERELGRLIDKRGYE